MPTATIELGDLKPFIAPVLLVATGDLREGALLDRAVREIGETVRKSASSCQRRIQHTSQIDAEDKLLAQAIVYSESAPPSWFSGSQLRDKAYHLVVVVVRDRFVTVCASDASMRERLVKSLRCVRRMPREAIAAFVGAEAKAIWLNGIHTPTASKADTKALTGTTLEYALDPIGDQTYYYSAARTMPDVPGLRTPDGRPIMVGAALASGRVWIRRSESWQEFKRILGVVIDHAAGANHRASPFTSLARSVESADGVGEAYSLSVVPKELLSEDDVPAADREAARRWAFDAKFDVQPLEGLSLLVTPQIYGMQMGEVELTVKLDNGSATIAAKWRKEFEGSAELRRECMDFLSNADCVKIYYESGHCIAQGCCYSGGYSDQPFDWTFESFATYDVKREKPDVPSGSTLAAQIAAHGDNSLFAFVVQKLFVDEAGKASGWLASDDGSMELADFIHIDPIRRVITLVHVKASSKAEVTRVAAPADYEIVVSQAVKNLRYLDRRKLIDELERGKGKKIGAAVWENGVKQANRKGFIAAARKLPQSARKVLMVLQPRVTKPEMDRCLVDGASPGDLMRMKQVNTLMLAARASALACGADFLGVADLGVTRKTTGKVVAPGLSARDTGP
jgi:hypothetical protein